MDRIFSILENLRKKPQGTRNRIAAFVAFFICLGIFLFWMNSFNRSSEDSFARPEVDMSATSELATPIENIKEQFSTISEILKNLGSLSQ